MNSNRSWVPWLVLLVLMAVSIPTVFAQIRTESMKPSVRKTPGFQVSASSDGYVVRVSPRVMKSFPRGAKFQITLDDPATGKTTISGTGIRVSDTSFKIKTPEKLRYKAAAGRTWLLIKVVGGVVGGRVGDPPCGGCPRDMSLDMDPDASSCWCYASQHAAQLDKPGVMACSGDGSGLPVHGVAR